MFPYVPFRECPCDYIHFTLKKSYTDPFDWNTHKDHFKKSAFLIFYNHMLWES